MKKCTKCGELKSLDDFPKRKSSPDGHRNECKKCKSIYLCNYRKDPPKKEVVPEGTKRCFRCKRLLSVDNFGRNKKSKDGLRGDCKECKRKESAAWRDKNQNYAKEYRESNKDKAIEYSRKYYAENKEELSKKRGEYSKENEEKEWARKKEWYEKNKEAILKNKKQRYKNNKEEIIRRETLRRRNNMQERLRHSLRTRLYQAVKKGYRAGSAVRDLGCSIDALKTYLENMFVGGMTWENYGKWQIDHIEPLASFDLTDREQFIAACNYKNLQPLWAEDNLKKGAKSPSRNKGE